MKFFVEIMTIIIMTGVPCIMWAVWYISSLNEAVAAQLRRQEMQKAFEAPTYTVLPHRLWTIVLIDQDTGRKYRKSFHQQITCGRTLGPEEPLDMMYIGEDQTISRRQCCLEETSDGLILRNLTSSNVTVHNGRQMFHAVLLKQGDEIGVGDKNYRVLNIFRTA